MIKAYNFNGINIKDFNFNKLKSHIDRGIWVDLIQPTHEEKDLIAGLLEISIPDHKKMNEIELSSRLYQHNHTLFATITIVTQSNLFHPESHPITFILHNNSLITVRYVNESLFEEIFINDRLRNSFNQRGSSLLGVMFDTISEQLSDLLESTTHNIEEIGLQTFTYNYHTNGDSKVAVPNFKKIISQIGRNENLLSKARDSLFTISRALNFILESLYFQDIEDKKQITLVIHDVNYLNEHATFLTEKMNFLLDATLGMINIEQSSIIKIVSVAAVIFLPPTLVASVYGMNFEIMPELNWRMGYPFALCLMLLSGFLPYRYFKYKGWL